MPNLEEPHSQPELLEEALNTSRKLWRVVEQSAELVVMTDAQGIIEYVNPAFEALTGYSREEAIGKTHRILKSGEQCAELYRELWDTILSGGIFRGVLVNRKKNGEVFYVEKTITPLRDTHGQITNFVSTDRDISVLRQLEEQLQQAQKTDTIGRFTGGIAHDFNNLLMVISAYAELALDELPSHGRPRANLKEIVTASQRAADLTRQLLAFGRKHTQSLQVLDINQVVKETGKMLQRLMGEDIQWTFLPGDELAGVRADRGQIEQVLMNLAANARDAMPEGGKLIIETTNVWLDESYRQQYTTVMPGQYVMLSARDSGEGISAQDMPHIFEAFYTTKPQGKGAGLGLATVHGIVEQNGGFVSASSEPKLGATFKIYLPAFHSRTSSTQRSQAVEKCTGGTETILLVEDEAAVRHATRDYLIKLGYTVLEAINGEEALRITGEFSEGIDLLIADVVMPEMGGAALAEHLKTDRPNMRVLFVSGYAERTVLQHGAINVENNFLAKPFSLHALAKKLRLMLDYRASAVAAGR